MNRIYQRDTFSNLSNEPDDKSSDSSSIEENEDNELVEKSRELFKDKKLKIKKIIELQESDYDGIQIITTGKKSLIIRDTTSQSCCESTSIEHDFNLNYFGKCEIESLLKTFKYKDDYHYCIINILLTNGKYYTVTCSNTHNGYYPHDYEIVFDNDVIDSFSL